MSPSQTDTVDVSVLIVGFRSLPHIDSCLASIPQALRGLTLEVLFVDQSEDGSEDHVRRTFPWVRVVPGKGNLGFAGGVNLLARESGGRHLVLLNPDVVLGPGALEQLVVHLIDNESCAVAGGLVELPDGKIDGGCLQDPPTLIGQLSALVGWPRYKRLEPVARSRPTLSVPTPSGAFLALRRRDFEAVGGMDESFFLYSEEVDLCRRIQGLTKKDVRLVTTARVRHDRGASHGGADERQVAMWKGKMHFDRKHHGALHTLLMGGLLWTHGAVRWVLGLLLAPLRPERGRRLRERFARIATSPGTWWGGYSSQAGNREFL